MTGRRTLYLPALIAAAGLMACAAALLAFSEKAEATFPGKNGKIAFSAFGGGLNEAIYTINPSGGGKTKVTAGYNPSYSPDGKKIAYTVYKGTDSETYTINVGGGEPFLSLDTAIQWASKTQITHNNKDDDFPSYSPDGKKIAYSRTTYR